MAGPLDLLNFVTGARRDIPSIMSPAYEARRRMAGPNKPGLEAADLLELLGDPMLLTGMAGAAGTGLAAKLLRRAGGKGGNAVLRRLLGADVMAGEAAEQLADVPLLYGLTKTAMPEGQQWAHGSWPWQAMTQPESRMTRFGPASVLTTRQPTGPTVPGFTDLQKLLTQPGVKSSLRQRLAQSFQQKGAPQTGLHEIFSMTPEEVQQRVAGGAVPEFRWTGGAEGILDEMSTEPLPHFGGRTAEEVIQTARERAESRLATELASGMNQPRRVVPKTSRTEVEYVQGRATPWTRPFNEQRAAPELLPQKGAPEGEHLVPGELELTATEEGKRLVRRSDLPWVTLPSGLKVKPRTPERYQALTGKPWPTEPNVKDVRYVRPETAPATSAAQPQKPLKTIVAGSRGVTDPASVSEAIQSAPWDVSTVVSGTARGVDQLGEKWASEAGVPVERFPAQWSRHGRKAGYLRNEEMAENAEALIAVWDGKSPGTKHMIDIARAKGIPVHVVNPNAPKAAPASPAEDVTTHRVPWAEMGESEAAPATSKQLQDLANLLKPVKAARGPASREAIVDDIATKLSKSGTVMNAPELRALARRFSREVELPSTGQTVREPVITPTAALRTPLNQPRDEWATGVLSGNTRIQPGQYAHLTPTEQQEFLKRAAFVGKKGTRVGEESLMDVPEAQREQIQKVLRDQFVSEEDRAAAAGATVTSADRLSEGFESFGGTAKQEGSPYAAKIVDRGQEAAALREAQAAGLQKSQQLQRPRTPRGLLRPESQGQLPSELVMATIAGDKSRNLRWTPLAKLRIQKAAREVGSEWEVIERLRQMEGLPVEQRVALVDPSDATMRKLAESEDIPQILARIDAAINTPRPGKPGPYRGEFEPSDEFDDMMEFSSYMSDAERSRLIDDVRRLNPAAARRLKVMWSEFDATRARTAGAAGRAAPLIHSETVSRRQPAVVRYAEKAGKEQGSGVKATPRKELAQLLADNADEAIAWLEARAKTVAGRSDVDKAARDAALARYLQEALQEEGVRAIKHGDYMAVLSGESLGPPTVGLREDKSNLGTILSRTHPKTESMAGVYEDAVGAFHDADQRYRQLARRRPGVGPWSFR